MTAVPEIQDELSREIARRRTFAIISHPDAGKTTLTEKLLLYGGAIEEAGSVRARKQQRHTTSDWMAMEQSRGISITSTVLQFEYDGTVLNLLDTPGHQDFSEDTYRTLAATDSAVMVLDGAKGIEPQTRKLFEVCRMRHIPILCFVNKLDQAAKDPFELLSEIEHELKVSAVPMNWPIGDGPTFQGVYDLRHQQVLRFERTKHGASIAPVTVSGLDDPTLEDAIGPTAWQDLRDAAELLDGAGAAFDRRQFEYGRVIPVFYGSAVNNFGVEPFLRAVIELAPPPGARHARQNGQDFELEPTSDTFTGFVFKIQANMDKRHRDRLAFMRITSGIFERDMAVRHARLGRDVRMTRPHRLFAQERETIDRAYPGDVIGFVNPGLFQIGDAVSSGTAVEFDRIPRFAPEHFATLRAKQVTRQKQFQKGLEQLEEEGAMQVFTIHEGLRSEPILAVVGELQFEVLQSRLETEYNVETTISNLPYKLARWIDKDVDLVARMSLPSKSRVATDTNGRAVVLFSSSWELEYAQKENPGVEFLLSSP
ncbi:MAG: peptide chain release factor 3 [Acidobacteriota bacterium]|jgi:peptide chain release factor 3|nr:peptide chain release factor 3 [Acidobacteriota bacterium]